MEYQNALAAIRAQQSAHPLSIIALAEPIATSQTQPQKHSDSQSRPSDALSTSETESNLQLTPATLIADLAHYKDLFSKLRFSYLEQVTKEKYLRSIVGDPPLVVSHEDNLALEERLAVMKGELKTKKDEVDALVKEMEGRARDVARAYDSVTEGLDVLERVPAEIETLRAEVESLQAEIAARQGDDDSAHPGSSGDPRMHLSLMATEQALMEQRERNAQIDRQIAELQKQMPAKLREVERMDRELADLEKRRNESTKLAIEGRRRREQGGRDEVEELGRWYRANEAVMKGLLGVEGTHGS
ncbi:uncharacterized protein Z520_08502 [Fonsecaea multimorphosa CBS 102226]|uniref:Kinetochore protein Sos7 coiled-coil domain-containing protein n=1 Tax=Fonsecaea multimorphosa CBS 102226 TaxID=1442371 RepID=A0A0D2JZ07_9EURO|nr:uncharacterized protein Z520_08502 [Fonsecaea multimorphosa CBS 102226]KIX95794.1 hypothetical protein Z520_08502 [Fonsecaea multimorphosa CBS 102226]OAL21530.1 hypothetical protein AYO22_07926 [Fonsecaea multimorphosa]